MASHLQTLMHCLKALVVVLMTLAEATGAVSACSPSPPTTETHHSPSSKPREETDSPILRTISGQLIADKTRIARSYQLPSSQDLRSSLLRVKNEEDPGCEVHIIGNSEGTATVTIRHNKETIGPVTVNYKEDPNGAPDTSQLGFHLFKKIEGAMYAVVVSEQAEVTISKLDVQALEGLGAVFYVSQARLSIANAAIGKIGGGTIAGVFLVKESFLRITGLECSSTYGHTSGFMVADGSEIEVEKSVFKENIGSERACLFFIENHSKLTLSDTHMKGSLPHPDSEANMLDVPRTSNFEADAAEAGVAYVRGESVIIAEESQLEGFPSIKGTVYIEETSTFECISSRISDNLALYGGAVYSQDSFVKWVSVHAYRNSASRGGAVLLHGSSSYDFRFVFFEHNVAIQGGGLFIEIHECHGNKEHVAVLMQECSFERNTALLDGGGIFSTCVSLNITDSTFHNNTAENKGGAVFFESSELTTISGSEFIGNKAALGGAVSVYAEAVQGDLYVDNTIFIENSASNGDGGAILLQGTSSVVNVSSCSFDSNVASGNGGGLYLLQTTNVSVNGSVFAGNSAEGGSGASLWVVDNMEISITGTRFQSGKSHDHGGEVLVDNSMRVAIESVNVSGSRAGGDGGALALSQIGRLFVSSSTIVDCWAGKLGGGISFEKPLPLEAEGGSATPRVFLNATKINSNNAMEGGGLFVASGDRVVIENCTLDRNHATNGGGIYASELTSASFSDLEALHNSADARGGALYLNAAGSLQLLPGNVFGNNDGGLLGGAIYTEATPVLSVQSTNFTNNRATRGYGGALGILGVKTLSIEGHCSFEGNWANGSGGAVYLNTPDQLTITETTFVSNEAKKGDGGALYFLPEAISTARRGTPTYSRRLVARRNQDGEVAAASDRFRFTAVNFDGNRARNNGGGVYIASLNGTIHTEKTYFEGCRADEGSGGCVYLSNLTRLTVVVGDFEKNSAGLHGGCLYLSQVRVVVIDNVKFDACEAQFGGALYMYGKRNSSTELHAADGVLTANKAAGGGAYFIKEVSSVVVDESKFYENEATDGSGGAMNIIDVETLRMLDMRMDKNTARFSCGAFCLNHVEDARISGVFTSNVASDEDGGVAVMQRVENASVRGTFSGNHARCCGGVMVLTTCKAVVVASVLIDGNSASTGDGGAVSVNSVAALSFQNASINGNDAVSGGGVALESTHSVSKISIENCTISGNKAEKYGGGLVVKRFVRQNRHLVRNRSPRIRLNVNSTVFESNDADRGGGVAILDGQVLFEGSNFTRNHAEGRGGGLYFDNALFLVVVNDSLVSYNTARKGGAMAVSCHTSVNFTNAFVGHNAARRRDDGALYSCEEHAVYFANVTFMHNFHNHEWYFYIIFIAGGYALLFLFLGVSFYGIRRWARTRKRSIIVLTYSDIGEHDPEAPILPLAFSDPPISSESDDEPVIAPKAAPSMRAGAQEYPRDPEPTVMSPRSDGSEIKYDTLDDTDEEPIAKSQFPDHV